VIGHSIFRFLSIEERCIHRIGATAVTEIPRGPNSLEAALVKCSTGAFIPYVE
jgi:hypothetical protein